MLYNMKEKAVTFENNMMRKIFEQPGEVTEAPKIYSSWIYKKLIRQEQTDEEKKANLKKRENVKKK